MKRLLICCAAMAFWAFDHSELAAQSGSRTGSYQSILSQSGVPGYNTGNYGNGYSTQGYPGITTGYQQPVANAVVSPQPPIANQGIAPAIQYPSQPAATAYGSGCNSGCNTGGAMPAPSASQGAYNVGTTYGSGAVNYGGGCDSGIAGAIGPAYSDSPVYAPGQGIGCGPVAAAPSRNYFYGLNGLVFDRDFEDDVYLTRNPAGDQLISTDADTGTLGGLEFFLGTRNACGNGFEARYWGLFADEATYTVNGASFATYVTGLQDLIWPTTGENLQTVFDRATSNTITRDNEIHNVELSMLRQGGCFKTRFGRCGTYELLSGFRWFEFGEEFHWDVNGATPPDSLFFDTEVGNTLLGAQLGSRVSLCMTDRIRFNVATKGGIYNNRARASQSIIDDAGVYATVNGVDYNFNDSKNDVSFLGELDLGVSYHTSRCSRVNLGYRVIGVSGIALAPDQYNNFNFAPAIRDVQTNGDLVLHGAYFGMEFCR